jgi:hypothetical protein
MITSKAACQAAAKQVFGVNSIGSAGPEWHAGCLVHDRKVYYSEYMPSGSHHQAVNNGYLCTKRITTTDVARRGVEQKSTYCGAMSITDDSTCKYAAASRGMHYVGLAGHTWSPGVGCFVHHGQAYFMETGTANSIKVNDGNLCLKPEVAVNKKGALYPLDAQNGVAYLSAMEDNTRVYDNGKYLGTMQAGQYGTFHVNNFDELTTNDKPIYGITHQKGAHVMASREFKGKQFSVPNYRRDKFGMWIRSVEDGARCTIGSKKGTKVVSVPLRGGVQVEIGGITGSAVKMTCDNDVVLAVGRPGETDYNPVPPEATEWVGIASTIMELSQSGSTPITVDEKCDNGSSRTITVPAFPNRWYSSGYERQYAGKACKFTSTSKFSAASLADGDGGDSTPFLSENLLSTKLVAPVAHEFIAIGSLSNVKCTYKNHANDTPKSLTTVGGSHGVYRVQRLGTGNVNRVIECDAPVFAVLEQAHTHDENLFYGTMAGMTGFSTPKPTAYPTTKKPTAHPTAHPTTKKPTAHPTAHPTTKTPTAHPTAHPTDSPTMNPTESPTKNPTESPTKNPTASPTLSPTERCNADNCMNWSCLDWCECYDESAVDVYNTHDGCKDDNEDTCICFDEEKHELGGERHRKINYNQDAVDAGEARFIEGTNIHMATKQNHYQEAGAKAGIADKGNTKKPVASSTGGVASTSYRHGLNAHGGYYQHCAALDKPIIDTQCQGLHRAGLQYDTSNKCEKVCCEDDWCKTWEFHADHGCWVSDKVCKHSGVTKRSDGAWVGKSPGWHGFSSMYGITL